MRVPVANFLFAPSTPVYAAKPPSMAVCSSDAFASEESRLRVQILSLFSISN